MLRVHQTWSAQKALGKPTGFPPAPAPTPTAKHGVEPEQSCACVFFQAVGGLALAPVFAPWPSLLHPLPALKGPTQEVKALAGLRGRATLEPGAGHAPSRKEKHCLLLDSQFHHMTQRSVPSQPAPFCCDCPNAPKEAQKTEIQAPALPLHVFPQSCQ